MLLILMSLNYFLLSSTNIFFTPAYIFTTFPLYNFFRIHLHCVNKHYMCVFSMKNQVLDYFTKSSLPPWTRSKLWNEEANKKSQTIVSGLEFFSCKLKSVKHWNVRPSLESSYALKSVMMIASPKERRSWTNTNFHLHDPKFNLVLWFSVTSA